MSAATMSMPSAPPRSRQLSGPKVYTWNGSTVTIEQVASHRWVGTWPNGQIAASSTTLAALKEQIGLPPAARWQWVP